MIHFILEGHDFPHEVQTIAQVFYPNMHYYQAEEIQKETVTIVSILTGDKSKALIYDNGILVSEGELSYTGKAQSLREKKRIIKAPIYFALKKLTGYEPKWGMMTGIRPAKTVNEILDKGMDEADAYSYLTECYYVSPEKARLAIEVAKAERGILQMSGKRDISIYIGIPFCPTRCLYCSFTSYPIKQYASKVDGYLEALIKEMAYLGEKAKAYTIKNVYIGGGTPTSLNEQQLDFLLRRTKKIFDTDNVLEFTVEAGRPDTLNKEKLMLMKEHGVSRISINPQTMNDRTLAAIGRRHSVQDIIRIFDIARQAGHQNINMDLILGLPGENTKDVENTMREIEKLDPESVTVHTLAVKRASRLKEEFDLSRLTDASTMEEMLRISSESAGRMGMLPYYMYRQKNMVGSFENVGYCKKGFEGVYNVEIMEEKQMIFAAGAGATTKLVDYDTNRIERVFNVKSVEDYTSRIDEMIQRKKDGMRQIG